MLYQQIEQNKRNTWIVLGGFTALLLAIAGLLSVYLTFWAGMIFLAAGIIYMVYIYFYSTRHLMRITHAVEINQENVPHRGFANRQIVQLVYVPAAGIPGGHWFSRPDQKSEVHCRCIEKAGSY